VDVERYLKLFTLLPTSTISSVIAEHTCNPGRRKAQHLLAGEVLELVHGSKTAATAQAEHKSLRNPSLAALSQSQSPDTSAEAVARTVLPSSLVYNTPFSRILYHAGIAPTKSEGARMIVKGGVYVAERVRTAMTAEPDSEDQLSFVQLRDQKPEEVQRFIQDGLLVLRTGKWKVRVVEVIEDAAFDERELDSPGWQEWKVTALKS
jgi:tyrosyl-tRNA synthetase